MKRYCLGFAFNLDCSRVLLIKKNRPDWQRGKLNGIGGRLEDREMPTAAMAREFHEETGILMPWERWVRFATMRSRGGEVICFTVATTLLDRARSLTDEAVTIASVHHLDRFPVLPNLFWLIPLAVNRLFRDPELQHVDLVEFLNSAPPRLGGEQPLFDHPSAYTKI